MASDRVFTGRHVIVRFVPDKAGIAKCAMGPELRAAVNHLAEHVAKPYAERISPRSNRDDHVHYADSFTVVPGTAWIAAMQRVAARLFNTAPHAAAVEWGNGGANSRGHRVLGRTLDHLNTMGRHHN